MSDSAHENSSGFGWLAAPLPLPKSLFFDLDGTLYRGSRLVPGADRLISGLARRGMNCWFVTNNSTRTPQEVAEHLRRLGIPAEPGQVITSALAAADYVRRHHPDALAYVIGENGLLRALEEAAVRTVTDPAAASADIVVQGTDRQFTYGKLAAAVRFIFGGAHFIQTNPDLLLPAEDGMKPGSGSIGAAIQAAAGIQPVVIGKPSSILMNYALKMAEAKPEDVWFVGDNPHTDIAAAVNAGCPSVLMLTGVCTEQNWEEMCRLAGVMPDAVCPGLHDLEAILTA